MSVTDLFDAYQRACVAAGVQLQPLRRPSVSEADWEVHCKRAPFDVGDIPASVIEWYGIADAARMLPVGDYWLTQLASPIVWDRLDDGFLASHPCEQSVQILYNDRGDIAVSTREQDKGTVWLQDWGRRIDGLAWRSIEHMLENLTALLAAGNLKPTNTPANLGLAGHAASTIPIPAIYNQAFAGGAWAAGTIEKL